MKKRTLSKSKAVDNFDEESDGSFISPFGLVSPMNNAGKSRVSNVMKNCAGIDILSKAVNERQMTTLTATFG